MDSLSRVNETTSNATELYNLIEDGNQTGLEVNLDYPYYENPQDDRYNVFGIEMAVPAWEAILTVVILSLIIIFTIVGNVLVILSVFTYKPLRIVQNFFIVSLAVADLTVAVLVLPFNVASSILGKWQFGKNMCKLWLTCDVLCCTSSILNLCAIALDRYWAITDPINYAQKRTVGRVLILIVGVWGLSLLISSPPLMGWNNWPTEFDENTTCALTTQKGYVLYSSLGSFYIPLAIMTIVYIEIFIATRRRLRERAQAAKINTMASQHITGKENNTMPVQHDQESVSSETNHNEHPNVSDSVATAKHLDKRKKREKYKKLRMLNSLTSVGSKNKKEKKEEIIELKPPVTRDDSITDNQNENSSEENKANGGENGGKTTNDGASEAIIIVPHPTKHSIVKCVTKKTKTRSFRKPGGVYQFIEEKQKISLSKERRAARTLGIIMGVFVICWLPFFLMYVIVPFCEACAPSNTVSNFITWLGYINSSLNPIIYTIFNLEYRRAFKRLLGIKF